MNTTTEAAPVKRRRRSKATVSQMPIEVRWAGPDRFRGADFNPENRTTDKNLKPLVESMRRFGFVVPILVTSRLEIIDGHRRRAAARTLGLAKIPYIVVPMSLQEGWGMLNTATRAIAPKEWVQAINGGYVPTHAPAKIQTQHAKVTELNPDAVAILAEKNQSFGVYQWVVAVANYCGIDEGDTKTRAVILNWLLKHDASYVARRIIDGALMGPIAFMDAISHDRKIELSKGVEVI